MAESEEAAFEGYAYSLLHDLKAALRGQAHLLRWLERDLGAGLPAAAAAQLAQLRERQRGQEGLLEELGDYLAAGRREPARERVALEPLLRELCGRGQPPLRLELPAQGLPSPLAPPEALRRLLARLLGEVRRQARGQAAALRAEAAEAEGGFQLRLSGGPPGAAPGRDLDVAARMARAQGASLAWTAGPAGGWSAALLWPAPGPERVEKGLR